MRRDAATGPRGAVLRCATAVGEVRQATCEIPAKMAHEKVDYAPEQWGCVWVAGTVGTAIEASWCTSAPGGAAGGKGAGESGSTGAGPAGSAAVYGRRVEAERSGATYDDRVGTRVGARAPNVARFRDLVAGVGPPAHAADGTGSGSQADGAAAPGPAAATGAAGATSGRRRRLSAADRRAKCLAYSGDILAEGEIRVLANKEAVKAALRDRGQLLTLVTGPLWRSVSTIVRKRDGSPRRTRRRRRHPEPEKRTICYRNEAKRSFAYFEFPTTVCVFVRSVFRRGRGRGARPWTGPARTGGGGAAAAATATPP